MYNAIFAVVVLLLFGLGTVTILNTDYDLQCKKRWPDHNVKSVNLSVGRICLIEINGHFIPETNVKVGP